MKEKLPLVSQMQIHLLVTINLTFRALKVKSNGTFRLPLYGLL